MKILGLYARETLSLLRRVRAPFSVLASRNHGFNLLQADRFADGITFSADVTVLANWRLQEDELRLLSKATRQRSIVVDCSDPGLLDDDLYRDQLDLASMVTVPNEWMRAAIKAINANVWVAPSCVDLPYFVQANAIKLARDRPLTIGCLGQYDWYLVKDAIADLLERYHRLVVIVEDQHAGAFEPHPRIVAVNLTVYNLPEVIRNCHFGLCPVDRERGYDDIWKYEYGVLCRPVIAPHPFAVQDTPFWVKSIEELIEYPRVRAVLSRKAFDMANEHRATRQADRYLAIYRKRLPHLALS